MLDQTNSHRHEPDESQHVEHTRQISQTDAECRPTVGLVCPGLNSLKVTFEKGKFQNYSYIQYC